MIIDSEHLHTLAEEADVAARSAYAALAESSRAIDAEKAGLQEILHEARLNPPAVLLPPKQGPRNLPLNPPPQPFISRGPLPQPSIPRGPPPQPFIPGSGPQQNFRPRRAAVADPPSQAEIVRRASLPRLSERSEPVLPPELAPNQEWAGPVPGPPPQENSDPFVEDELDLDSGTAHLQREAQIAAPRPQPNRRTQSDPGVSYVRKLGHRERKEEQEDMYCIKRHASISRRVRANPLRNPTTLELLWPIAPTVVPEPTRLSPIVPPTLARFRLWQAAQASSFLRRKLRVTTPPLGLPSSLPEIAEPDVRVTLTPQRPLYHQQSFQEEQTVISE